MFQKKKNIRKKKNCEKNMGGVILGEKIRRETIFGENFFGEKIFVGKNLGGNLCGKLFRKFQRRVQEGRGREGAEQCLVTPGVFGQATIGYCRNNRAPNIIIIPTSDYLNVTRTTVGCVTTNTQCINHACDHSPLK